MASHATAGAPFSLGQARGIVKDLFKHNPAIYWADFLSSIVVGGIGFVLLRRVFEPLSWAGIAAFIVSGLCYYRAVLFIHELVHMRDNSFRAFSITWNLLCGIPFLMPTFLYYTHADHHLRKHYATQRDGEYIPLGTMSPIHILIYLCQPFVLPLIAIVRFVILTPLCWCSPRIREIVQRRASSMVMDPTYIRPLPTRKAQRIFRLQEALCFLWCAGVATVIVAGIVPMGFLITAYCLAVFILTLNGLRTLGAHRYTNAGGEVTFLDQLLDSLNYPNRPFVSALWAPVGLRFHALHHLFPSMPYHNLATAHRRLMAELPADSPYRLTESPGLVASLVELWRNSRAAGRAAHRAQQRQERRRPHQHAGTEQRYSGAH